MVLPTRFDESTLSRILYSDACDTCAGVDGEYHVGSEGALRCDVGRRGLVTSSSVQSVYDCFVIIILQFYYHHTIMIHTVVLICNL